jgi:hypothetical protein
MCRDNGVEINTCIHWMGHADAKMILKVYDSVSELRDQAEATKLSKKLNYMQNNMQAVSRKPPALINQTLQVSHTAG